MKRLEALRPEIRSAWTVGTLTLLAAGIRFFRLGAWSLWADEVFTVRDALRFPEALTINPIPYAAVAGAIRLWGVSEGSVRWVPALVGTLSVPLIARMGARLLDRRSGEIAALFGALLPWHVFWSQNARHYVFTFLFATLAAWAFFEGVERNDKRYLAGSWGAVGCLLLSHLLSGALILGFAGYVGIQGCRQKKEFPWKEVSIYFAPFGIGVGATLLVPAFREALFSGWGHNLWARNVFYVAGTFLWGVTLPVGALALFGAWLPESDARRRRATTFLACLVGFPVAFFLLASWVQNVAGYYLFFVTPFVLLLAGRGCTGHVVRWGAVVAVVSSLAAADLAYFTAERGGREDWKGAFAELAPHLKENDCVFMLLPEIGTFYLPGVSFSKLTLDDIADPNRLAKPLGGTTYLVVDAKAFAVLDPSGAFRRWVDAHAHRLVRRVVFARTSDRTVEIFRLTSTGKPNPPP